MEGSGKTEEEIKEFLENIHIEYQFSCYKENNGEGCCLLGEFYQNVKEDFVKAAVAFKRACDQHDFAKSCFKFGSYLYKGCGVKRDLPKALEYQRKACDLGWKEACVAAGIQSSEKDADTAASVKFFEKACDLNSDLGCYLASGIYFSGTSPIKADMQKALELSIRACDLGHPQACANTAYLYEKGYGIEQNLAASKRFKEKALDLKRQYEKTRGLDMEQGING